MSQTSRSRVAIACQGGGSHTSFTAGVLQGILENLPDGVDVVALSGTSGGAICATLAWEGLLRKDPLRASAKLKAFWDAMSATELVDAIFNQTLLSIQSLRDLMVMPEISPYHLPTWGEDKFRGILHEFFDFEELKELARRPGAPALQIGAVEVVSGQFELFSGPELSVECLLASAAIPEMFRAVPVPGRGVFWDGLFSQNPPLHDLVQHSLDEIWLIQINSTSFSRVPTETHEILDRRNSLSGNLSMLQELRFIEAINRRIAAGDLRSSKYRVIDVGRISLDRQLGWRTKLDRRPELLEELREYGKARWRLFANDRESRMDVVKSQRGRAAPLPSE